jgi:hypothetical protein
MRIDDATVVDVGVIVDAIVSGPVIVAVHVNVNPTVEVIDLASVQPSNVSCAGSAHMRTSPLIAIAAHCAVFGHVNSR